MRAALKIVPVVLMACGVMATAANAQAKKTPATPAPAKKFTVEIAEGNVNGLPVTLSATLRETRQGSALRQTEIEVCFAVSPLARRVDRFTTTLTLRDGAWRGSAVTMVEKAPVEILLTRSGGRDTPNLAAEIRHKDGVVKFEQKEANFFEEDTPQENNSAYEVSPSTSRDISLNTVSIIARPAAISTLLPVLRKHQAKLRANTLITDCDALKNNMQNVYVEVDAARAKALVDEASKVAGIVRAGWTTGTTRLENAIRIPRSAFMGNGSLDKEKLLSAISATIAGAIGQAATGKPDYDANRGIDTLSFAGPSAAIPDVGLVDTTEISFLIAPESLQPSEYIVIYLDETQRSLAETSTGAGISVTEPNDGEQEGGEIDTGFRKLVLAALARSLNGEAWNDDARTWVRK